MTNDEILIDSIVVVIYLLKNSGIKECKSIVDVIKLIEKKAATDINEYEFFK
jgi:hypothetical protein